VFERYSCAPVMLCASHRVVVIPTCEQGASPATIYFGRERYFELVKHLEFCDLRGGVA
jgi:hypothetical protein